MLQVRNETAFVPGLFVFPDEQGVDTVYTALKATFELGGEVLRVAGQQRPLILADEYWGEPGASSIRYASEGHLLKPGTDVVVVGHAYAPGGRATASCQVSVTVGPLSRKIAVFGERRWLGGPVGPRISKPEPFDCMPLTYERAYGGSHEIGAGRPTLAEPRNPVGRGFRGERGEAQMLGRELPNLEDPRAIIQTLGDAPMPVGTGFVAPSWAPRSGFAGTYDQRWREERAPYLPLDFRPEFFRMASPGLGAQGYLSGGEAVELVNIAATGTLRFRMPRCEFEVGLTIAGQPHPVKMRMETVLIEPDAGSLSMVWRGAQRCDKRVLRVERADFRVKTLADVAGDA